MFRPVLCNAEKHLAFQLKNKQGGNKMSTICKNCGTQVNDGVKFCTGCGKPISPEGANNVVVPSGEYNFSTGAKGFVDTNENGAYSLRNGLLMNYISGEGFVKEDAVITNRRLYYSTSS